MSSALLSNDPAAAGTAKKTPSRTQIRILGEFEETWRVSEELSHLLANYGFSVEEQSRPKPCHHMPGMSRSYIVISRQE